MSSQLVTLRHEPWRQTLRAVVWLGVVSPVLGWAGLLAFIAFLGHEFGHYILARIVGATTYGIQFRWAGAQARIYADHTPAMMAKLALAGPFAGLLVASLGWLGYVFSGHGAWAFLAYLSVVINLLALAPIGRSDGLLVISALEAPAGETRKWARGKLLFLTGAIITLWAHPLTGVVCLVASLVSLRRGSRDIVAPEINTPLTRQQQWIYGASYIGIVVGLALVSRIGLADYQVGSTYEITSPILNLYGIQKG